VKQVAEDVGRREQNKRDKLRRIKAAAQELFVSQGYDATTIREIANHANVGLGTLFSYAKDKRDLLFLILNDGFKDAVSYAEAATRVRKLGLEDCLLRIFKHHYVLFSTQPHLYRYALRELQFYEATDQAAIFQETRERLVDAIRITFDLGKERADLDASVDTHLAARAAFSLFQAEVRHWIAHEPRGIEPGIEQLMTVLQLLLNGLRKPAAVSVHSH
jgi:AcrR family transcriptional regulator